MNIQERIKQLEENFAKQLAELKQELQKDEKPKFRNYQDLINNAKLITGFYIEVNADIYTSEGVAGDSDKNVFATESQAKSALAMSQLSQLMRLGEYNGDWTPYWKDEDQDKWGVFYDALEDALYVAKSNHTKQFLVFYYNDIAYNFIEANKELILQYYEQQ